MDHLLVTVHETREIPKYRPLMMVFPAEVNLYYVEIDKNAGKLAREFRPTRYYVHNSDGSSEPPVMITLRMTTEVTDDRRVVLTLPPEVPTGRVGLVITVESADRTGSLPRGVPAAAVRGIGAGSGEPPDDVTAEQWVHDRRLVRYG